MKFLYILALFFAMAFADKWAVLLAGSTGYYNYRHQSDVYHMYHVLIDHGFDPEHIITIAADDLAYSKYNPFPGKVFNHPGNNQRNFYEGVVIDYKTEVSAEIYLNILLGNEEKVKELTHKDQVKVLKTDEGSNVFLYYIDHGGTGIVAMPDDSFLEAKDLVATLVEMHEKKLFNRLVYYLEACESGSMWLDLPENINVYALSSTVPDESSWGTYCPGEEEGHDDTVDGQHIGSCLGEVWSCFWLEQDDVEDLTKLSLQKQFDDAKNFTTTSHPLQYGDLTWSDAPLSDFIAEVPSKRCMNTKRVPATKQWNSRDNALNFYEYQMKLGNSNAQKEYEQELASRKEADEYFSKLVGKFGLNLLLDEEIKSINWQCYSPALHKYHETHKFTDYSLKYAHTLAVLCNNIGVAVLNEM